MRNKATVLLLALALLATACSDDGGGGGDATLLAFAPTPFEAAVPDLEAAYEADHDVDLEVVVGDGADLEAMVAAGDVPDVFIGSTERVEAVASSQDGAGTPAEVGYDILRIVVPKGNPGGVADLAVFGDAAVPTALCAPGTDCGDAAQERLAAAGVTPTPTVEDERWLVVLDSVADGESQAALLYRTQLINRLRRIDTVVLPDDDTTRVDLLAVSLGGSEDGEGLVTWLAESDEAADVLRKKGLRPLVQVEDEDPSDGDSE